MYLRQCPQATHRSQNWKIRLYKRVFHRWNYAPNFLFRCSSSLRKLSATHGQLNYEITFKKHYIYLVILVYGVFLFKKKKKSTYVKVIYIARTNKNILKFLVIISKWKFFKLRIYGQLDERIQWWQNYLWYSKIISWLDLHYNGTIWEKKVICFLSDEDDLLWKAKFMCHRFQP